LDNLTCQFSLEAIEALGVTAMDIAEIGPPVSENIAATVEAFLTVQAAANE
jgi:hypothetical protein